MPQRTSERVAELREAAADREAKADALDELYEGLKAADSIGDTPLSGLFHEARTTSPRYWKKASAFVKIRDGAVVVEKVSKLREGRWAPETRRPYDTLINASIRPFMSTEDFLGEMRFQITEAARHFRQSAEGLRREADVIEQRD